MKSSRWCSRNSTAVKGTPSLAIILTLAVLWPPASYASEEYASQGSTFTFYQENDLYTGSDRDYTNGIKMSWISPDLTSYRDSPALPSWSHRLVETLPFMDGPDLLRTVSFSLGQNIYTPEDIEAEIPDENDRPYAGITYGAIGFHSRNARIMDTWEFDLGIVGPHSYAENSQKAVHRWTDSDYPQGWDYQIQDEPIINLFYERKWRLFPDAPDTGWGWDMIPHVGCALGNALTAVNGGGQARFGWNLPNDFGTLCIRPGSDTNAPVDDRDPRFNQKPHRLGMHVFTAVDAYACLRDITLDGNTFRDSPKVTKYPFTAHLTLGLGMIAGRFKITYAFVTRTREYTSQDKRQRYGTISISYTFGS